MSQEPTIISQSKESEEDKSVWKLVVLVFLGVASSFTASYYFNEFFITAGANFLWLGFLFATIFSIFIVLNSFFVKNKWLLAGIIFIQSALFLLFFFRLAGQDPSEAFLAGVLLFLFFVTRGAEGARKALINSARIRFFEIARIASSKAITAFLIFLSIIFYVYYFEQRNLNDSVGKVFSNYILDSAEPIVNLQIPGVSFNQTVDKFITTITENTLRSSRISVADPSGGKKTFELSFSELPYQQKNELIIETKNNIKKSLEKDFGVLDGNEKARDAIYGIEKGLVEKFSDKTKSMLGIGFVILLFFTLKGISFIWLAVIEFISFLFFKLLVVLRFANVNSETRVREFITLS